MITQNQIKLINSLALKKNRYKHQLFVVEGKKNVAELINSDYEIDSLYATNNWINENPNVNAVNVSHSQLERISSQKNPNSVLAIVKIKDDSIIADSGIILVLDGLNDPGNMGTIIRICDWFGVRSIICSNNTVDKYNPKVVQSAMGSIFRVAVVYANLLEYLKAARLPVYGAFMNGDNVRDVSFPKDLYLVVGNEANGISKDLANFINRSIKVKNSGNKAESLNVAVATSILLHEICS